jgi:hypothetical protein
MRDRDFKRDDFARRTSQLHAEALPQVVEAAGGVLDLYLADGKLDLADEVRRKEFIFNLSGSVTKAIADEACRQSRASLKAA